MRAIFYILFLLFNPNCFFGQNLVSNSSFETITNCPNNTSAINPDELSYATGWDFPTAGSADLFNACNNSLSGSVGVPDNYFGFQNAYHGNSYAGISVWWSSTLLDYTEYIQTELLRPLDKGEVVSVRFYVNLAEHSSHGISKLSCLFTEDLSLFNSNSGLPVITSNNLYDKNGTLFTDTANWLLFETEYIASGCEKYFTIGCFESDLIGDTVFVQSFPNNQKTTYYFIDSVSVISISKPNQLIPNVITPNNDGVNDVWLPEISCSHEWNCAIINRWGNVVYSLKNGDPGWNGNDNNGLKISNGVYFYRIEFVENKDPITGFIHLYY